MGAPKVLLIDDNLELLEFASLRLANSGFKVSTASSGENALELIRGDVPDIIILDMFMPVMDGAEVLRRLRSDNKTVDIPIIILSAAFSAQEKSKALDLGADDYITKPYQPEEFISRINFLLRRSQSRKSSKVIKNILITGGAGFVGSHLAHVLLAKDYNVSILDDLSTGRKENLEDVKENKNLQFIIGSITDEAILSKLIEQSDLIYHFAATVGVKNVVDNPLDTIIYDTIGTELVLKYASLKGAKVILTSTSEVYGKSTALPFKEDTDLIIGPPDVNRWSYACSKLLDEFLAISYHRERNLPVVVIRMFNVVGPGQVGKYGMVIPRFFKRALANEPIIVYGDGQQVRCFTYIDDVIEIIMDLAVSEEANGEVINLGCDSQTSINDLALKIKAITKSSSQIIYEPYSNYYGENFQDIRKRAPDLTKLRKIIGRVPQDNIDIILTKIKDYFIAHPQEIDNI